MTMRNTLNVALAAAGLLWAGAAAAQDRPAPRAQDETLPINAIQVIGTHNSYALPIDRRVTALMAPRLTALFDAFRNQMSPEQAAALREEHPGDMADMAQVLDYVQMPIEAQLRSGVRSLELDIQPDPQGGAYSSPLPYRLLRAQGVTDLAPIYEQELARPGLKVFHLADLDFRSQCPTFRSCLTLLRQWSDSEPGHSPVFILLEPKLSGLASAAPGATVVPPFDAAAFAEVDDAIVSVLGRDKVFTPDDLRGDLPTLEAAVLAQRWPSLAAARGKFVFLFIVPGMNLDAFAPYLKDRPSLQGRMAFVQGRPGMAHTACMMFDNAVVREPELKAAVAAGYIVRTRADIDTVEARNNDTARREAALASGAQVISTDYLTAPNIFGNTYAVPPFTGGWRCNPVVGACDGVK